MDKEYLILKNINGEEKTTQRNIASGAGISLGTVNMLLKQMTKKGLVKVERLNSKTLRYILTPKGMQEKIKRTYNFARASYRRISIISDTVKTLVENQFSADPVLQEVVLFGPEDEVREIIEIGLKGTGINYKYCDDKLDLDRCLKKGSDDKLLLVWRVEEGVLLDSEQKTVNVMDSVLF